MARLHEHLRFGCDTTVGSMATEIDGFFADAEQWREEMLALRPLVVASGLHEEWKWRQPCYTHRGKNVVMIAPFKSHCTLSFFQGVLLSDTEGLLTSPGKDSQSARQWRFTSVEEIVRRSDTIAAYLDEAMGHVDAGTAVEFTAKDTLQLPDELIERFDQVDGLEDAFHDLTPGRQRGFVLHINGAKKSSTRSSRVDGHVDRILAGKGIHDCVCGKSARLPRCDGSHSR